MRFFICACLFLIGCGSTKEITHTEKRDQIVTFQPKPIDDTITVGELPSRLFNPQCDTLAILNLYGSFDVEKEDSSYFWRAKYDATTRQLRLRERRPAEVRIVPILEVYLSKITKKQNPWDYIKVVSPFAIVAFVVGFIARGFVKIPF
jgi:hypothetical protein